MTLFSKPSLSKLIEIKFRPVFENLMNLFLFKEHSKLPLNGLYKGCLPSILFINSLNRHLFLLVKKTGMK